MLLLLLLPVFGDGFESRFRIGPFFETRKDKDGTVSTMVRPFYSRVTSSNGNERVSEVLWPISHWNRRDDRTFGRVLNASWWEDDVERAGTPYSFLFFPLYNQGRDRKGEDYWAFFPFYGHVPNLLVFAQDVDFILFPFYFAYTTAGSQQIRTRYYLWPLYSVQSDNYHPKQTNEVVRSGFFPFYGNKRDGVSESTYVLWPFWIRTHYESQMRSGDAWMAFPFYARILTDTEKTWMALPPFIRRTTAEKQGLMRVWPFYEDSWDTMVRYKRYWPFYGERIHETAKDWFCIWPFAVGQTRTSPKDEVKFTRVFPFFFRETKWRRDGDGNRTRVSDYVRVWPFYSRTKTEGGSHEFRSLELFPLRNSPSFERTFVPFWTLYEFDRHPDGTTDNYLFWGLINW